MGLLTKPVIKLVQAVTQWLWSPAKESGQSGSNTDNAHSLAVTGA